MELSLYTHTSTRFKSVISRSARGGDERRSGVETLNVENLLKGKAHDRRCVSCSDVDYVGHDHFMFCTMIHEKYIMDVKRCIKFQCILNERRGVLLM